MPNYCWNNVSMRGIGEGDYYQERDDGKKEFDFEKISPVPSSIMNTESPTNNLATSMALEVIIKGILKDRYKFGPIDPEQKNIANALVSLQVQLVQDIFNYKQKGTYNCKYTNDKNGKMVKEFLTDDDLISMGFQIL